MYGIMTMSIAIMMMNLLNDIMVTKNERLKKQEQKKGFYLLLGILIVWRIDAFQKTKRGSGSNG